MPNSFHVSFFLIILTYTRGPNRETNCKKEKPFVIDTDKAANVTGDADLITYVRIFVNDKINV
jgi:hypothetical protein